MPAPVKDNEIKRASMEKRLAQMGAKIDHLMVTADQAREEVRLRLESLKEKEKNILLRGEEALDECKSALEKAWDELSHAWLDIKEGAEKAAQKLQPESPPDQSEQIAQHHSKNTVAEYDCFFCDRCREYIYDELKGDESRGIPPQTWVDCLPKSWQCPVCGSAAQDLRAVTLFDDFSEDEFKKSGLQEKVDASRRAAS
jgi:rubredoxin